MNTFRLLLLTLLLAAMPIRGFSYTKAQVVEFDGYYYQVDDATKLTLCFIGTKYGDKPAKPGNKLVLPAKIKDSNGYFLTVVGAELRPGYSCPGITEVALPETMEYIGGYAFSGSALTKMNIPKNLANIKESAWNSLYSAPVYTVHPQNKHFEVDASGTLYSKGRQTLYSVPSSISLPSGVYTVDSHVENIVLSAFQSVTNLTKLKLPVGLKKIWDGYPTIAPSAKLAAVEIPAGNAHFKSLDGVLFRDNDLVLYPRAKPDKVYTVPTTITGIVNYAISATSKLEQIKLNNVKTLLRSAIYNATLLTTITIPKKMKPYDEATKEGMAEGCFESCPKLMNYVVEAGNDYYEADNGVLFSKGKKILYFYPASKPNYTYTIPGTVETISVHAFQGSKNITSMYIPANVKAIKAEAFRDLPNLKTLTFDPNSKVESIEYYAFRDCRKLKEVTLPKSLLSLGEIFHMCTDLETINIPAGSKLHDIKVKAFATNANLKAFNFLGDCALTKIEKNVFAGLSELQAFNIPKSVNVIESNAFIGCAKMKTVTFHPDAVIERIGEGAFSECGITSINIPSKVKNIEREAFLKCQALTNIHVTKATTKISPEAFKYCTNLVEINVDRDNTVYSSIDGYLLTKNKETLVIFPTGKANDHFTLLPPSITAIGDYAFYDCKSLKNVTIPNKVASIGKRAFGLCTNLNTITFLCDNLIEAGHINQQQNEESFDADKAAPKAFGKIHINVRENMLHQYQTNSFYQQFASISPSFKEGWEEYIAVSDNAVSLLATTQKVYTLVIPKNITHNSKPYAVNLIGDYAFENAPADIEEVVVTPNVKYVGAKAFVAKSNKLKKVFFIEGQPSKGMLSTTRFELDETGNNYNEFSPDAKIYVKKSAYDEYKEKWTKTIYNPLTHKMDPSQFNFTSQIDYRITDYKIKHKYATFAREFDVDFSDCALNNGARVAAFVGGKKVESKKPDYGNATRRIRMTSIDQHGGVSDSYAYVPAGTGVLLKIIDKVEATDNNFYYTIGEKDNVNYNITDNVMRGVIGNNTTLMPGHKFVRYVMQEGTFRLVNKPVNNFPVHRAYLQLNSSVAGAKLEIVFDDDETTTDIDNVTPDAESGDDVFYNLNGQRVNNPQKGIYIHQGKKVIVK